MPKTRGSEIMRFGNTLSKYYGLALGVMVVILAVSNVLLLTQNLQLRNLLKKFEPDRLYNILTRSPIPVGS